MSRPSCPRGLERKLNHEVNYYCPICGGLPLVRAHTIKKIKEVGWDYDYLLSICVECEQKVENNQIPRTLLNNIKQQLRLSFSHSKRIKPHQISLPSKDKVIFLGNNTINWADIIFKYKNSPILWFETINGIRVLNARFYDIKGTVITAIDKNQWTADRSRFYDIQSETNNGYIKLKIIGKHDDTEIELVLEKSGLRIGPSSFYIPGSKVQILQDGRFIVGGINLNNYNASCTGVAFAF